MIRYSMKEDRQIKLVRKLRIYKFTKWLGRPIPKIAKFAILGIGMIIYPMNERKTREKDFKTSAKIQDKGINAFMKRFKIFFYLLNNDDIKCKKNSTIN